MAIVNKNNIKNMSPEEILKNIRDVIAAFKKSYSYLIVPSINIDSIILEEIKNSKEEYDGSVVYNTYIIKKIKEVLIKYLKEQIDLVLKQLSEDEIALLQKKFGLDYTGEGSQKLTKEENQRIYTSINPKMRR